MPNAVQVSLLLGGLLMCCLVGPAAGRESCTSCGKECEPACGSRRYRTCCFNYLRKRSSAPGPPPQQELPEHPVQLELLLMPRDQDGLGPRHAHNMFLHRLLDAPPLAAETSDSDRSAPPLPLPLQTSAEERAAQHDWLDGRAAYNE